MKKISDYIKSIGFIFSFRRLKKAIILVVSFVLIGVGVFFAQRYINSEKFRENMYKREVEAKYDIADKKIINVVKDDITENGKQDYIALIGNEVYSTESDTNNTLEKIDNVDIVVIDTKTDTNICFETKKSFADDVNLSIVNDEKNKYIFVSDTSGNIVLATLNNDTGKIEDIINNTTDNFLGYTIYIEKETDDKINVTLDNYEKNYLDEYNEKKELDFGEYGIDISRYRETYLRDTFSSFKLEDKNEDGILELCAFQNLLYCLDETDSKTIGVVETVFSIEESKLKFSDVKISML